MTSSKNPMPTRQMHRHPLPSSCVDFSSSDGKIIFQEALNAGFMECYFRLAAEFRTQDEPTFCGLTTLVMILNALEKDPSQAWKGPWRLYQESMLDCCMSIRNVQQEGITFDEFICLAECNSLHVKAKRATEGTSLECFRDCIKRHVKKADVFVILSYSRKGLNQTGDGHFSPVGGYHENRDLVLILDTARYKYPPHWVPVALMWESMRALDELTEGYQMAEGSSNPVFIPQDGDDKTTECNIHATQLLINGIDEQTMDSVVKVKSQGQSRQDKLTVSCSMKCTRHTDEVLQRYCKTCNMYICIDCITETHVGHTLQKFTEIIKCKKLELSCAIEKTKSETVVDVERKLNKSRELRVDFRKASENRLADVKQRAEFLKDQIEKVSEEVQNELCKLQHDYEDDFQNAEEKLSKSLEKLQEMVNEYEVALSNDDHGLILKGCQNIGDEIEQMLANVNVPTDGPPAFRPGARDAEVKEIFGQLEDDYEKFSDVLDVDTDAVLNKGTFNRQRNSPIRVRRDHKRGRNRKKLNLSADIRAPSRIKVAGEATEITAVLTLNTTEAIVLTNEPINGGNICRVNRSILQTEKFDVGRDVYDIALLDSRTLMFTESKDTELYAYDLESQQVTVKKSFSPYIVGGLCCMGNGTIVCCISDKVDYDATENCKRSVVLLSEKEDTEFEFNGNSTRKLFTIPSRVTVLGNSNLCVIDRLSEKHGRVVVFSQESKVKFTYDGLQKSLSFDPTAVASHRNSVLIAERKFGIHELTTTGMFARYILNDSALWNPRSLTVDSESKAWIGCENGYILRMRIAQDCFSLMSIIDTETDA